jgi:non-ribosomal peptide synthetase component F
VAVTAGLLLAASQNVMLGVHRIVEGHAAARGDEVALIGADRVWTFRELNQRANALARFLIDRGLRRGSRAIVRMERGPELAMALLAVLKAGAAYTWFDLGEGARWPTGISVLTDQDGQARTHDVVSEREAIQASSRPAPNLPILTRGHDVACVMPQPDGSGVLVPHSSIAALQSHPVPSSSYWSSTAGALDLWVPLMAGSPVLLTATAEAAAA